MKTLAELNQKILDKTAIVVTSKELKARIRNGEILTPEDVDVVTCGTFGVMSGTAAVLAFQVGTPGSFSRVLTMKLNDVPAYVGPCPNENNGHADCIVFGTSHAENNPDYGGGHLFADLAAGNEVVADIVTDSSRITLNVRLSGMSSSRLIVTRGAFKNYMAFVNPGDEEVKSIFSTLPLKPKMQGASVSGCGEINPLENDPSLRFHQMGTQVLVNGGPGLILGCGTRSSPQKPNLSLSADMQGMNADFMGGFITALGAECLTSVATAIPILDDDALRFVSVLDEQIPLPVADIQNRTPFDTATYADVWQKRDLRITVNASRCVRDCRDCAKNICPVHAIQPDLSISKACVGCMTCVTACPLHVYTANAGELHVSHTAIPITLRQSDRVRGEHVSRLLRDKIRLGSWRF